MSEEQNGKKAYLPVFLARQPIFDVKRNTWGSELLYRHSVNADKAVFIDKNEATLNVVAGNFLCSTKSQAGPEKIHINFTQQAVRESVPYALPAPRTVVEITEQDLLDRTFRDELKKLKLYDYRLAVDDFQGLEGVTPLLGLTDIVIIDVLNKTPEEVEQVMARAKGFNGFFQAKRVENIETFQRSKEMGFSLFQGFFFQKPELIAGRKLSAAEASKFNILRLLEREDPDIRELTQVIKSDVSISYRLLSYLNSASFCFLRKITSLEQAVTLLGWKQLKSWLKLIVLTDLTPPGKTSELPYLSVLRAKFLESAALTLGNKQEEAESFFMLGLLSLLEPMLDLPIQEILEPLPVEERIKQALYEKSGDYHRWLRMATCFETGDWDELGVLVRELGLNPVAAANCYYEALGWTNSFYGQVS